MIVVFTTSATTYETVVKDLDPNATPNTNLHRFHGIKIGSIPSNIDDTVNLAYVENMDKVTSLSKYTGRDFVFNPNPEVYNLDSDYEGVVIFLPKGMKIYE